MSDLYQMLCTTDVLKSVWSGLLRPKRQKFKVTAKGGDRSAQFIQWPLLRVFGGLLLLTGLGIANAFLIDQSRPLAESSAIALFWSWYNIIILTLACYVCSEQQQRRKGERFDVLVPVAMTEEDSSRDYFASDISASGMHLLGEPPVPIGTRVGIRFAEVTVCAHVRRKTATGFGLQFEMTPQTKTDILRYIFSNRRIASAQNIKPHLLAQALASRVFR
jgi:cellulose synthase (UDP-forming)